MPSTRCPLDRSSARPCRCLSAPSRAPSVWTHRRRPARPAKASRSYGYGVHGEINYKDGSTGRAVELDQAAVAAYEVLRDTEPEARACGAARDERIENRVANVRGHARAVVLELNRGHQPMALPTDADVGRDAGPQGEPRRQLAGRWLAVCRCAGG